jgi:hypothetical protein
MIKHGLQNCVVSEEKTLSGEIIDDILSGKRALIATLSTFKSILSERVKKKRQCGFYISEANYKPLFMLFSTKFNKKLKEQIDFRYVRISL